MLDFRKIPYLRHKIGSYIKNLERADKKQRIAETFKHLIQTESPLIFDVGANVGQSIELFSGTFSTPRFHAFEPDPQAFEFLVSKYGSRSNVTLNHLALSSKPGVSTFFQQPHSKLSGLRKYNFDAYRRERERLGREVAMDRGQFNRAIEVKTTTLDQYRDEHAIDRVDILKIDVQGGEDLVLEGARNSLKARAIGTVFLEIIFRNLYESRLSFSDIERHLHPNGYNLASIPRISNVKGTPLIELLDAFYALDC